MLNDSKGNSDAKWGHFFNIMTTVTVSYFSLSDSYTVTASIGSYWILRGS